MAGFKVYVNEKISVYERILIPRFCGNAELSIYYTLANSMYQAASSRPGLEAMAYPTRGSGCLSTPLAPILHLV